MPFKDILVALNSYPDPTPVSVVEDAVAVAAALGAHLAAVSCETRVQLPGHFISAAIVEWNDRRRSRQEPEERPGLAGRVRCGGGKSRHPSRSHPREMPDAGSPRPAGGVCAASRPDDPVPASSDQWYAEADHFRIGQADPDPAGESEAPAVPARDGRGSLGFQPRRRARDIRRPADARTGEEGSHRDRHQREGAGHQAFRRRAGQEPRPARHRCRAGQGRRQGPMRSARFSNPIRRRKARTCW